MAVAYRSPRGRLLTSQLSRWWWWASCRRVNAQKVTAKKVNCSHRGGSGKFTGREQWRKRCTDSRGLWRKVHLRTFNKHQQLPGEEEGAPALVPETMNLSLGWSAGELLWTRCRSLEEEGRDSGSGQSQVLQHFMLLSAESFFLLTTWPGCYCFTQISEKPLIQRSRWAKGLHQSSVSFRNFKEFKGSTHRWDTNQSSESYVNVMDRAAVLAASGRTWSCSARAQLQAERRRSAVLSCHQEFFTRSEHSSDFI